MKKEAKIYLIIILLFFIVGYVYTFIIMENAGLINNCCRDDNKGWVEGTKECNMVLRGIRKVNCSILFNVSGRLNQL